jgi:ribosomal protein S27AE
MPFTGTGSFGSRDKPTCPKCGAATYLIRRSPHSKFGKGWERQIFACSKCHRKIERSADKDGQPHAA